MTFLNLLPPDLKNYLHKIENAGFSLCLVGGASRDFLLSGKLSTDLDFEVRKKKVSELKSFFQKDKLKFEELPYEIVRVSMGGFDLEFSCPRIEMALQGNFSHHHFVATLDPSFDYKESFLRRDFTINAIGIELDLSGNTEKIIDPFGGHEDLKKGQLREISHYFFSDSVRFLRLIRFHLTLGFSINQSILSQLASFDLSELSLYHFKEELRKSNQAAQFLALFKNLTNDHQLNVPEDFNYFREFEFNENAKTSRDLIVDVYFKDPKNVKMLAEFFSFPDKTLKSLESFDKSYKMVSRVNREHVRSMLESSFASFEDLAFLKELKNLYEKKEWVEYFDEIYLLKFKLLDSITINKDDLLIFPKEIRSYYRFYLYLFQVIAND